MSIRIITVEREYGSGGAGIAEKLARRLGWKLWDTELTQEIARRAKVKPEAAAHHDERVDPLLYRLFKVFARGSHERALPHRRRPALRHRLHGRSAAARHRGSRGDREFGDRRPRVALYSAESPGRLQHFCVRADRGEVRRVRSLGKSEAEARELVGTIDKERGQFIKRYFGADWPCRQLLTSIQ